MTYYEWTEEQKKAFDELDKMFWISVIGIVLVWIFLTIILQI